MAIGDMSVPFIGPVDLESVRAAVLAGGIRVWQFDAATGKCTLAVASGAPLAGDVGGTEGATVIQPGVVTLAKLATGLQRGVPSRTLATAITVVASDMGGVIHASAAGAQACSLLTMAASLVAGFDLVFEIAQDGAATLVTVTPGAGVTIDGSAAALALTAGYGRRSFASSNGLAWLTKAV